MRNIFAALIIAVFVSMAVLGFAGMNHSMESSHAGCIASVANDAGCPNTARILDFISFHLNAFKNFSTAVFGKHFIALLLLIAVLYAIGFQAAIRDSLAPKTPKRISHCRYIHGSFTPYFKTEFIGWLALHENSPSFS